MGYMENDLMNAATGLLNDIRDGRLVIVIDNAEENIQRIYFERV